MTLKDYNKPKIKKRSFNKKYIKKKSKKIYKIENPINNRIPY
jgi:hypothetical protein